MSGVPKRVAILISGSGSNMVRLIESMVGDHPARCVLVASSEPDAGGIAKAAAMGVPVAALDHRAHGGRAGLEAALQARLEAAEAEIVALAGFMRILSPGFVAKWQGRMLNVHPSLLPLYPGLHTHARTLAAGDSEAGCTIHEVTADLDAGPILGQARVPILPGDTPATLAARVQAAEHRLYPAVLRRFAGGCRARLDLPPAGGME